MTSDVLPLGDLALDDAGLPLPLALLRDELSIDAAVADSVGGTRMIPPLVGIVVVGFAGHAVCVAGMHWPSTGPGIALQQGAGWFAASTLGFFAAISAGLPGAWFHGVVAKIRAPAWRLAVELVRVQAVGSVVLAGLLPFWLVGALGLYAVAGIDLMDSPPWVALTYGLPFLAALPGVMGLYRGFLRMRVALGESGTGPAALLTLWWVVQFVTVAPITIWALHTFLLG